MFQLIGLTLWVLGARIVGVWVYDYPAFINPDIKGVTVYHESLPEEPWNGAKVESSLMASELFGTNYKTGGNCGNGIENAIELTLRPGWRYHVIALKCEYPGQSLEEFDVDLRCADLNHDGYVDAIDYDNFVRWFLEQRFGSDMNCDGFVDAIDLDLYVTFFVGGQGC